MVTTNILHISDLHYTKRSHPGHEALIAALKDDLSRLAPRLKPDVIIFSGDLVYDADEESIYDFFYDDVLEPIAKITRCREHRIFICPGNHDAQRSAVKAFERLQTSLTNNEQPDSDVKSQRVVQERLFSEEVATYILQKFAAFNDLDTYLHDNSSSEKNAFFSLYRLDDLPFNILSINSAALTWAGIQHKDDKGILRVAEHLLPQAIKVGGEEKATIVVSHHPLDWFEDNSRRELQELITKNAFMHLYGHMHDADPKQTFSLQGALLSSQAGALFAGKERYNGYNIISVDSDSKLACFNFRTFYPKRGCFDTGTDLAAAGVWYPTNEAQTFWRAQREPIDLDYLRNWITKEVLPIGQDELNEGITDKSLAEVFVPPTIFLSQKKKNNQDEFVFEKEQVQIPFHDLATSNANYVVFGRAEYGKTTLFKQLALRLLEQAAVLEVPTFPIMIDFQDIKPGKDRFIRILQANALSVCESYKITDLLEDGLVTILVDDVDIRDEKRMKLLREFVGENSKNRFLFSAVVPEAESYSDFIPDFELPVSVESVFLAQFSRNKMRSLVAKFGINGEQQDTVLSRLVRDFESMNIPVTAVNGTILLTILEAHSNFTAINRASLIERFIEMLLEKFSPGETQRRTFDFDNKKELLAYVAWKMVKQDRYVVSRDEMFAIFNEYLSSIGLNQSATELIQQLVNARVFVEKADETISFRYRAFLEYFIALRMERDAEFFDWVISEERYLSFINEFLFYAGLNRRDERLIETVSSRFRQLRDALKSETDWCPTVENLENFRLPDEESSTEELFEDIESQLALPALSDEERDAAIEGEFPRDKANRQEVFRPLHKDNGGRLLTCLFLYSGLLKNLEHISDDAKRRHLNQLLEGWGYFTLVSLPFVPTLAVHRKVKISGITYTVNAPKHYSVAETARMIYMQLPISVAETMSSLMATEKLERQLVEPRLDEVGEPKISTLYRNMLIADMKLSNWLELAARFLRDNANSDYMTAIVLQKLNTIHLLGGLPAVEMGKVRLLIATQVSKKKGGNLSNRHKNKSSYIEKLKKKYLFRQIKLEQERLEDAE